MLRALLLALVLAGAAAAVAETAGTPPPLAIETKIALGVVRGRIDHLAVDVQRQRLLVAELGNDSLGVVDLAAGKLLRTIGGFTQPQGVGYEASTDAVYVANAGDGSVRILRGEDFAPLARIDLGNDADNVRIDAAHGRVLVGYGNGALAVIDPQRRAKIADLRLPAHPEGFQLLADGTRAVVNLPDAHQVEIADLAGGASRSISTGALTANFPLAIDGESNRALAGFRHPPMLAAYTLPEGRLATRVPICGDADDLFVDAKRHRIYISCGAGLVDILEATQQGYRQLGRITTASGARTSLFVPEFDRLFVAAPAGSDPAAIWVLQPR